MLTSIAMRIPRALVLTSAMLKLGGWLPVRGIKSTLLKSFYSTENT